MTLDGVGKSIGLDLNIFKVLDKDLPKLVSELLSQKNAQEELMWVAKDVLTSFRILPKHLKWFLKEMSQNNYSLELRIRGIDEFAGTLSRSIFTLGLSILAGIFVFSGIFLIRNIAITRLVDIPVLVWILWSVAAYFMVRIAMLRKF
jgi:ubiquinone biosynthesis protein